MDHVLTGSPRPSAEPMEREVQLVREAIAMVASGGSRRVVVAGIRLGDAIYTPGSRLALESGVRLTRLANPDGAADDLAVERIKK
jgi:hypothetical protein